MKLSEKLLSMLNQVQACYNHVRECTIDFRSSSNLWMPHWQERVSRLQKAEKLNGETTAMYQEWKKGSSSMDMHNEIKLATDNLVDTLNQLHRENESFQRTLLSEMNETRSRIKHLYSSTRAIASYANH